MNYSQLTAVLKEELASVRISTFMWSIQHGYFGWLENVHIAHLKMLAVLVAIRIWKQKIRGVKFAMCCDNEAMVTVINSGRSRNQLLQTLLREIVYTYISSMCEMEIMKFPMCYRAGVWIKNIKKDFNKLNKIIGKRLKSLKIC